MVGIVVVSHSAELVRGLAALAGQLAGPQVRIEAAGGLPDGGLGTSAELILAAIERADGGQGVLLLGDLGSALLTARVVLEDLEPGRARLANAPLVEGAISAAVLAAAGASLADVLLAAEEARDADKF